MRATLASADISGIAGQNDDVVVRVSYPAFPVVRSRVYVWSFNDCAKRARLLDRSVERAHLEPEQLAKTMGRCVCIAKVRVPVSVPGMKLKNHLAILD
ncbi:MAG TPA: hypothetical protein VFQ87_15350, partial [Bradyrhizobium sp.]|nr:hypothetical protein [Bradyrhizobium sp.]